MSCKKPRKAKTAGNWDVKGKDVPGGRFTRSVMKDLTKLSGNEQLKAIQKRRAALDRIRSFAFAAVESADREALWNLIPTIGHAGYPTWDEVTSAVTVAPLLGLARRGELFAETNARLQRGAQASERRTCAHSVDEYLRWQEQEEFAVETSATAASILRRMLQVRVDDGVRLADTRLAALTRSVGRHVLEVLAMSERKGARVQKATSRNQAKTLRAWLNWELAREKERADEQGRAPLFSANVFDDRAARYSSPTKDSRAKVEDRQTRRFYPDEMERLLASASTTWRIILVFMRGLGLRPGEFMHLRWLEDVRPLTDGVGYEVLVEGGRGRDVRCPCKQCRSERGWAPKNGPRRYILDRGFDSKNWVTPVCDVLDRWVLMRRPERGDFLFCDPDDAARPWTSNKLNGGLHELAALAGVQTGRGRPGRRTFHSLRHTCASQLLEAGVSHPHAAYWIGDTLEEFTKTYGRPTDEAMTRAIFGS